VALPPGRWSAGRRAGGDRDAVAGAGARRTDRGGTRRRFTRNTARVDRSVHCGGDSSEMRPPAPRPHGSQEARASVARL
jgi:hypothetical protein